MYSCNAPCRRTLQENFGEGPRKFGEALRAKLGYRQQLGEVFSLAAYMLREAVRFKTARLLLVGSPRTLCVASLTIACTIGYLVRFKVKQDKSQNTRISYGLDPLKQALETIPDRVGRIAIAKKSAARRAAESERRASG